MTDGLRVEVADLTERFGEVTAVAGVGSTVAPGRITGFLGANGADPSMRGEPAA